MPRLMAALGAECGCIPTILILCLSVFQPGGFQQALVFDCTVPPAAWQSRIMVEMLEKPIRADDPGQAPLEKIILFSLAFGVYLEKAEGQLFGIKS